MKSTRPSYHRALTGRAYVAIAAVAVGILLAPWLALGGWKAKKAPTVPAGPPEDRYPDWEGVVIENVTLGANEKSMVFPPLGGPATYEITFSVDGRNTTSFTLPSDGDGLSITAKETPLPKPTQ